MSTKVNRIKVNTMPQPTNTPAFNHRMQIRRRNRNIRMCIFGALICIIVIMCVCHSCRVRALNEQITELSAEVSGLKLEADHMTEENRHLNDRLLEYEHKLGMFVDIHEVETAGAVIYSIPLDEALQEYTYNLCVDYYIPEHYELILAMMWQESNYTPDVVSGTNDYGLMQINKVNHDWLSEELGVEDFLDPEQNIHAGVYVMAKLIHKYGDISKALMAYNMGERGASTYWDSGVYSSNYSNSVIAKHAAIKMNNYGSK